MCPAVGIGSGVCARCLLQEVLVWQKVWWCPTHWAQGFQAGFSPLVLRVGGKTAVNFCGGFAVGFPFCFPVVAPDFAAGFSPANVQEVALW